MEQVLGWLGRLKGKLGQMEPEPRMRASVQFGADLVKLRKNIEAYRVLFATNPAKQAWLVMEKDLLEPIEQKKLAVVFYYADAFQEVDPTGIELVTVRTKPARYFVAVAANTYSEVSTQTTGIGWLGDRLVRLSTELEKKVQTEGGRSEGYLDDSTIRASLSGRSLPGTRQERW